MAMMMTSSVSYFLAIFGVLVVISADKVPVLIWSPSRPLSELPQAYAGNSIEGETFMQKYLAPLASKKGENVVAFIQDKLHMEDFSKFADVYNPFSDGGAFKNIKNLMDENFSVNLPAVQSPMSVVDSLMKEFGGNVHEVSSPEHVSHLQLDQDKTYLILVRLTPTAPHSDEEAAIKANDEKVGEITKALNKRSVTYTAIFTGQRSKRAVHTEHTGRRLLATADNITGIFVNTTGDMFFYSRNIQVIIMDSDKPDNPITIDFPTEQEKYSANNSEWSNSTAYFQLDTSDATSNMSGSVVDYKVTFNFTAELYADRWKAVNLSLTVSNSSNNNDVVFDGVSMSLQDAEMVLPPFFSYHCSDLKIYQSNTSGQYAILRFDGLQFQPFGIQNDQFSDPWDCVGFFTTPIWMGLVPVAIFTVILFCGMYMIAQLSTMDRFDDPKGKTLTVNVNE